MNILNRNSLNLYHTIGLYIIKRGVIHNASIRSSIPKPLKLAYISYEDTKSHNVDLSDSEPPLIIMHGLFGSKGNWNSLSKAIQQRTLPQRKVFAVDARNHGDSPHSSVHTYEALALDIKEMMDSLRISRAALLGHSMGGRAVMMFALKWPQMVESLIVADISPISNSTSLASMSKFFRALQKVNIQKNLPLSTARAFADTCLARTINDKGIRAFLLTNLVQKPDGSFAWRINISSLINNYKYISAFPKLENIYDGPTMFIAGGASDYIQKGDYKDILKIFPMAKFRTVEGAGHWLHSEKPHEFLKFVLEILNRKVRQYTVPRNKPVI